MTTVTDVTRELDISKSYLYKLIDNKIKYKCVHKVFDKHHEIPLETITWHKRMLGSIIYNIFVNQFLFIEVRK